MPPKSYIGFAGAISHIPNLLWSRQPLYLLYWLWVAAEPPVFFAAQALFHSAVTFTPEKDSFFQMNERPAATGACWLGRYSRTSDREMARVPMRRIRSAEVSKVTT